MKYAIKTKQGYVKSTSGSEGVEYTFELCEARRFEEGEAGEVAMALLVNDIESFPVAVER